jgi:hypothetical protein
LVRLNDANWRKGTLAPGEPQPHVDFIEAPRFGRRSQS